MMNLVKCLTIFCGWGMTIFMAITFYQAYLSPSKSIMITVNRYGEAWWEAVLIGFLVVLVTIGSVSLLRTLDN